MLESSYRLRPSVIGRGQFLRFQMAEFEEYPVAYQDRTLICRDCGAEFIFTAGEQDFYAQKGFEHEPTRCTACRQARKRDRGSQTGERAMYDAVCTQCGAATQVPFSPRPDKPVYCPDCYRTVAGRRARV